ncbi:MAG: hypothetical protein Q9Q40_01640 [Acidobacteriota bacterium]|nr:hypothetical protein [Acidobacteriota bacterium]MDQ7086391.1 hypothetical protein [Acidobacteriota bacterium]
MNSGRPAAGADPGLREEIARLEQRIEELATDLARLRQRADGMPAKEPAPEAQPPAVTEPPAAKASPGSRVEPWAPLVGRSLIVLSGAFVLRALTENDLLRQGLGVGLACIYALVWLVAADLAGAGGRRLSAAAHGLMAAAITLPLVWEATVDFRVFSPLHGLVVLSFFSAMAVYIADRHGLVMLAAAGLFGGLVVQAAIAFGAGGWEMTLAFALAVGLAADLQALRRGWRVLAGGVAGVVDLLFGFVTAAFLFTDAERAADVVPPGALVAGLVALVVIYVVPGALRAIRSGGKMRAGEMLQAWMATLIGLGGAVGVCRQLGSWHAGVGSFALTAALALYALSFFFADRRIEGRQHFIFFSFLALAFAGAALPVLFSREMVALSFSLVALLTAWLGARFSRATLSFHAAFFCGGAVMASGLWSLAWHAWTGSSGGKVTGLMGAVWLVCAACTWMRVAWHGRTWGRFSRVPKVLLIAIAAYSGGGLLVAAVSRSWSPAAGDRPLGIALSTMALSVVATMLAELSRSRRLGEARWLVYPTLGLGAVRLLLVDLRAGSTLASVLSLVALGGALILTSLRLKGAGEESAGDA